MHVASNKASAIDVQVQKQIKSFLSLCDHCNAAEGTGQAQVTVRKGGIPFMAMKGKLS